eukprot:1085270-Prorocentrum_lima.AAC.1
MPYTAPGEPSRKSPSTCSNVCCSRKGRVDLGNMGAGGYDANQGARCPGQPRAPGRLHAPLANSAI